MTVSCLLIRRVTQSFECLKSVVRPKSVLSSLLGRRFVVPMFGGDFLGKFDHAFVYRIWGAHLDYISGDCSVSEDRA